MDTSRYPLLNAQMVGPRLLVENLRHPKRALSGQRNQSKLWAWRGIRVLSYGVSALFQALLPCDPHGSDYEARARASSSRSNTVQHLAITIKSLRPN